ncbi:hypothetical protein E3J84_04950 [Candidatus Aerophobetes bacterium]|uniref:OmpH family outer membrane protein n=1 Tax=Aerophobetes bacterium TaxID=2030807 RepID=A0A523RUZ5_UNCAE|nr:MAG: hypothetical protein E3J84_04950 [Candidatus Aerophobetes bacterium]
MMKKNKRLLFLTILLCLGLGLGTQTAKADIIEDILKAKIIGYIDFERSLSEYEKNKDLVFQLETQLNSWLERQQREYQQILQEKEKEIGELTRYLEELEEGKESGIFAEAEEKIKETQAEIERKKGELESLVQQINEELQGQLNEELQKQNEEYKNRLDNEIIPDIMAMVEVIAVEDGYRFVFDKRDLIYIQDSKIVRSLDITEKVLLRLNEEYKKSKEEEEASD